MQHIDQNHMNMVILKAASKWKFASVYEDLLQVGRIAYWQCCEESDPDYLMVTKVRRRMIDAWRQMTNGRSKYKLSHVELKDDDIQYVSPDYFTARCLGLPERHTMIVSAIADGALKSEVADMMGVSAGRISQLLAEARRMIEHG